VLHCAIVGFLWISWTPNSFKRFRITSFTILILNVVTDIPTTATGNQETEHKVLIQALIYLNLFGVISTLKRPSLMRWCSWSTWDYCGSILPLSRFSPMWSNVVAFGRSDCWLHTHKITGHLMFTKYPVLNQKVIKWLCQYYHMGHDWYGSHWNENCSIRS
jgi:hypothetical protein